ncbi:ALG9 isoform 1 [Pan troglodytes]|uniref:ALG9 alpha-1,2-mannosyltransferase n=2 Tax=Homininae TaxID=207598 RepID=A0A087WTZ3_HUMAN|nr:ALG9 alpha-1,2-mannosyltransferase [Homo sapiens]KAI4074074.1 ALG9 alpha-1,2-mannosyltransferase [Homo sapiens]PNI40736.1 ALG9 isoform 1 [Pan troglodytes]
MASRGARQRLKGSGASSGDTAPAADKLRELLGSREAGGAEHRTELSGNKAGQVWAPEGSTAFKCLLSARLCAALLSNISDCDETFNYWEPVDTLPHLWGRVSDLGIFPSICHSLLCLPVASCLASCISCKNSTN